MTSAPEDDPRYISSDRIRKLAFLFRREVITRLRKDDRLLASTISCALRGDDESNPATQNCVDQLVMMFHPDKQHRREAAQQILDDLEFGFESSIKQLEFTGSSEDLEAVKLMRGQIQRTRETMERKVGKLRQGKTIDAVKQT